MDEVMEEVLRDRKFYDTSGGGVTLSGGEPSMQADVSVGTPTAVQKTKGSIPHWIRVGIHPGRSCRVSGSSRTLCSMTEVPGRREAQKATGQSNELIIENVKKMAGSREMWIRVPLVPGFNDSEEEVRAILAFIKKEIRPSRIDLHRYNPLGEEKYARLDKRCTHLTPQPEEDIERFREMIDREKP